MTINRPPIANQTNKLCWGDVEDENYHADDFSYFAPPEIVTEPDENGIKRVISYKLDDEGRQVKCTTTILTRKLAQTRLSKGAFERKSWNRFGDAADEDDGTTGKLTVVSSEEINLELLRAPGTKTEGKDLRSQPGKAGDGVLKLCRICDKRGDHWTAGCPFKDLAQPSSSESTSTATASTSRATNTYLPPNQRAGTSRGGGSELRPRNTENELRVNNLSEDTGEADLGDLFGAFGSLSRVTVVRDHKTGIPRGFGFVKFVHKSDAEMALAKLNGYGYDNLILSVEWADPRPN